MQRLKKTWWIFSLLGIAAAFFNPYIGVFAMIEAILMFVNGCFVVVGRIRCRNKNRDGFQMIAKIQSSAFWPVILFNIVVLIIFIKVFARISNSPQRTNMGFIPLNSYDLTVWVPAMWILFIAFEVIYLILLSLRLYDLYWNKNYTMESPKVKIDPLKQPKEHPHRIGFLGGIGKIWFIFLIASFTVGCFSVKYPALTLIRLFLLFPYIILLINKKISQFIIRKFSGRPDEFLSSFAKMAQHGIEVFRGKGIFILSVFTMIFVECIIVVTEILLPGMLTMLLYLSILCDAFLIVALGYKLWEHANKEKANDET